MTTGEKSSGEGQEIKRETRRHTQAVTASPAAEANGERMMDSRVRATLDLQTRPEKQIAGTHPKKGLQQWVLPGREVHKQRRTTQHTCASKRRTHQCLEGALFERGASLLSSVASHCTHGRTVLQHWPGQHLEHASKNGTLRASRRHT
jgi:hypothetical protein